MSGSLTSDGAGPLVSSLRSIFSQASLKVTLAGLTETERNRDIVFYDETLVAAIRCCIPASDKTLPFPPSSASQTSFSLPIPGYTEGEEDEGPTNSPPRLLSLLISSLQVSLDASYTAPRLSSASSHSYANQPEASTSSKYLVPATSERDAAYRNVALQQDSNTGEVTQVFNTFWNGNKIPQTAPTMSASKSEKRKAEGVEEHISGGDIWYTESKGVGMWVTEWRCKLPITFVRTRHPTPALLLTTSLILRLQPSQLGRLSPSSLESTASASESLYLHDLLNPLTEGPSYPDESSAERAARANASLAKLPLGKLPSSVLGSKLVTPARNAKEISSIIVRKSSTASNGDMGDTKEGGMYGNRRGGRRALTNEGLMAFKLDMEGSVTAITDEQAKGLGEDVIVLQRSARRVLDVQSAILVRMRTITVPDFPAEDQSDVDSLLPTLILCVEVENPINSGIKYSLDNIEVVIDKLPVTSSTTSPPSDASLIGISMHRIGERLEPLVVEQGSQINLLYQATFDCPGSGHDSDEDLLKALSDTQRNISIKLFGRPVLLQSDDGGSESYTPTDKFISTWTCTLDLAAQMRIVALQKVMHNGAGSDRFRAYRPTSSQRQRFGSGNLPYRSFDSAGPLPHSPNSALPRTPSDLRSASTMLAPVQTPRMFSLRKPSVRSASAASSGVAFVSLQRSVSDQQEATSPALSSALVGHSIMARARQNRSSTTGSGTVIGRGEDSRQLLNGKESYDEDVKRRNASESTVMSMQRNQGGALPSLNLRSSNFPVGGDRDMDKDAILPIIDRRFTSTVQRLLFSPVSEGGVLIDVVSDPSTLVHRKDGQIEASIQVQVENRSDKTRTFIISWQIPAARTSSSIYSALVIQDDDVQIGPLYQRDTEATTLKICFTKPGLQPLPPLAVYDTFTGIERVLHDLQMIVVE